MLNKSSEGGQSCLVLELEERVFTLHILSMILAEGLLYVAFIMLRWLSGKNPPAKTRNAGYAVLVHLWVGKISWRKRWQPTPVFLPRKSYGQRRLVGYSPWGCKKLEHGWAHMHIYSLYTHLVESFFFVNECWILSNAFFASIKMIIWLLYFILVMYHAEWFEDVKPSFNPWYTPHLIIACDLLTLLLNLVCDILLRIFTYMFTRDTGLYIFFLMVSLSGLG